MLTNEPYYLNNFGFSVAEVNISKTYFTK